MLFYEDLSIGYRYGIQAPNAAPYGFHQITAEQIVAFGRLWDPRPQHTDEDAARESSFGGLIASGAQAFAIWTRLAFEAGNASEPIAIIAGLGSEFRISAPIRPGDVLSLRVEITDLRVSRSRPETGILSALHEMTNQSSAKVFENRAISLVSRRPSNPAT